MRIMDHAYVHGCASCDVGLDHRFRELRELDESFFVELDDLGFRIGLGDAQNDGSNNRMARSTEL